MTFTIPRPFFTSLMSVLVFLGGFSISPCQGPAPKTPKTGPAPARLTTEQRAVYLERREALRSSIEKVTKKFRLGGKIANSDWKKTEEQLRELRRTEELLYGKTSDELVHTLRTMIWFYGNSEEFAAAADCREALKAIYVKRYGADHWRVKEAQLDIEDLRRLVTMSEEDRLKSEQMNKLNIAVVQLYRQRKWKEAIPQAKKAMQICRELYGERHREYADCLFNLGSQYAQLQDFLAARPYFEQAAVISLEARGAKHPQTIKLQQSLAALYVSLAGRHIRAQEYSQAKELHHRRANLLAAMYGERHWRAMQARSNVEYVQRLSQLDKKDRDELLAADQITADFENNSGTDALKAAQSVVDTYRRLLGERHASYGMALMNLAIQRKYRGEYNKALALAATAIGVVRDSLSESHPLFAGSLHSLASMHQDRGEYDDAEKLYQQALRIRRQAYDDEHGSVGQTLNNLATLRQQKGDFAGAYTFHQQALAIRRNGQPLHLAETLGNLGAWYAATGDHAAASYYLKLSLRIREAVLPANHRLIEITLNNLAADQHKTRNFAEAERLYQRALKMNVARTGSKDNALYGKTAANLSAMYRSWGRDAESLRLAREAMEITKRAAGEKHPDFASRLANLALAEQRAGHREQALAHCRQALKLQVELLGPNHPDVADTQYNLALMVWDRKQPEKSVDLLEAALDNAHRAVEQASFMQSAGQQMLLAREYRDFLSHYVGMGFAAKLDGDEVYRRVLRWKAAVFLRQQAVLAAARDPQASLLMAKLHRTNSQLSTLAYSPPDVRRRLGGREKMDELVRKAQELESDLARTSAAMEAVGRVGRLEPSELCKVVPDGVVLVDFWEYRQLPDKTWRLAAFVVREGRPVLPVDLGPLQPVVAAIEEWRKNMKGQRRSAAKREAPEQLLRRILWEPLQPHLRGASTVLISPDGDVSRLPWAALPGKKPESFLIEDWPICVFPVPQLLPQLLQAKRGVETGPDRNRELLLVGNIDFAASPGKLAARDSGRPPVGIVPRTVLRGGDKERSIESLPASKLEIDDVAGLYRRLHRREPTVLQQAAATEQTVRDKMARHHFIHFATHGFFATAGAKSALQRDATHSSEQQATGLPPDLLSGIVLAGATRQQALASLDAPRLHDGILTATEVKQLDLRHTELVALSACETGLGAVAGGEGTLGLQRAFQLAGARTTVTTLWRVHDASTSVLMERFYTYLWEKRLSKLEALRRAQLDLLNDNRLIAARDKELRDKYARLKSANPKLRDWASWEKAELPNGGKLGKRTHPFYWAAFVLAGDWR